MMLLVLAGPPVAIAHPTSGRNPGHQWISEPGTGYTAPLHRYRVHRPLQDPMLGLQGRPSRSGHHH